MRLHRFISLVFALYLPVLWACYALSEKSGSFDLMSVLLMTSMTALLIFFMEASDERSVTLFIVLSVVVFLYFHLRFLVLIFEPEGWKFIEHQLVFTADEMNRTLVYMLAGIVLAGAGFLLGAKARIYPEKPAVLDLARSLSADRIAAFTIVIMVIHLLEYWVYGFGRFSLMMGEERGLMKLNVFRYATYLLFAATDVLMPVYLLTVFEQAGKKENRSRVMLFAVGSLYAAWRLFLGSKQGLYALFIALLLALLVARGDFRINLKKTALFLAAMVILSPLVFYGGLVARLTLYYGHMQEALSLSTFTEIGSTIDKFGLEFDLYGMAKSITKRMSGLEPLILMVNERGADPSLYVNWTDMLKSTLDLLLPGQYFPDSFVTARLWQVIYLDAPYDIIYEIYHTPLMTMWGVAYLHWKWLGLAVIFTGAALLSFAIQAVRFSSSPYRKYMELLLLTHFHLAVISMGIEESVYLFFQDLGRAVVVFAVIFVIHPGLYAQMKRRRVARRACLTTRRRMEHDGIDAF